MGRAQMGREKGRSPGSDRALPSCGRRCPLLLQHRLRAMLFWPAFLIGASTTALVVLSPPGIDAYWPNLVLAGSGGWAVAGLTLWFSLRAFVCCRADGLWLRTPFYELLIPYRAVQSTRLSQFGRQFPLENERWSRRRFLEPLFFSTVVAVELDELPASRQVLRLWLSHYLLSPDTPGFMFPVRDWLGFRSELDEHRSRSHVYRTT